MKNALMIAATMSILLTTSCKIDQTKETELPDVNVSVEEGQLPEFNINWADVNVDTKTETVEVPKVVIVMEEMEVEIPYLDVDMPTEYGDKEERTIRVEAEVDGFEHEIEIDKVYANKNNLVVVSELQKGDTSIADKKMRVSDQLKLNAPDLNVKHYIIGEKPNRVFNDSYKYVSDEESLNEELDGYSVIYSD